MTTTDDISNAHWRAVGTVAFVVVLTTGVLGVGVAIGYNLSAAQVEHSIQEGGNRWAARTTTSRGRTASP